MIDRMRENVNIIRCLPEWLLPLLIILAGAGLRLALLGTVPGGLHQDESFVALNAFDLFHEGRDSAGLWLPVYMSSWGDGQSAMYIWLLVPLLALNGGHVNAFLLRLPQAIVAIFTLWAVYCLMGKLFSRRMALWSAFLLAVCPWHVMMSRWGLDANLAPGFLIFGLYFFVRGMENKKYLLLSALFYGFSLYCYALLWPVVPVILLLGIVYGLAAKKMTIDRWSVLAALILTILALPLLLFVLVNAGLLPQIELPFMTIPKTSGYRGTELASSFVALWGNLKNTYRLLRYQDTGSVYDVLLPWGMFYDVGRVFIVIGVICLLWQMIKKILHKEYAPEALLFIQLVGGGITALLVTARLHQLNDLFIPLVLCEAYGVECVLLFLETHRKWLGKLATVALSITYIICTVLFQRDYYGDYRQLVSNYFAVGVKECVEYSLRQCEEKGISVITAEKGAQWPRLLLLTETLPSEYLREVEYDVAPAPAAFSTHGIRINTRIDYDHINKDSIYIIYYTDVPVFEQDYTLTQFYDWYVAVPKR